MRVDLMVLLASFGLVLGTGACKRPGPRGDSHQGEPPPGTSGQGDHHPGGRGGPPPKFSELDSNGDGKLSQQEAGEEQWKRIARSDSDGDGLVSEAEFNEHRTEHQPPQKNR